MNHNKAYRELRAWAVRHNISIEIQNIRPRYKREAHVKIPTAFSSKRLSEIEFGHQLRNKVDFNKEERRVKRIKARRLMPLFKE
jgi:hypothetical protein